MAEGSSPNSSFARAFIPGLIVGLVIGLVAGAVIPPLLERPASLPTDGRGAAAPARPVPRDQREDPMPAEVPPVEQPAPVAPAPQ